jgi:hypothetical protein
MDWAILGWGERCHAPRHALIVKLLTITCLFSGFLLQNEAINGIKKLKLKLTCVALCQGEDQ